MRSDAYARPSRTARRSNPRSSSGERNRKGRRRPRRTKEVPILRAARSRSAATPGCRGPIRTVLGKELPEARAIRVLKCRSKHLRARLSETGDTIRELPIHDTPDHAPRSATPNTTPSMRVRPQGEQQRQHDEQAWRGWRQQQTREDNREQPRPELRPDRERHRGPPPTRSPGEDRRSARERAEVPSRPPGSPGRAQRARS